MYGATYSEPVNCAVVFDLYKKCLMSGMPIVDGIYLQLLVLSVIVLSAPAFSNPLNQIWVNILVSSFLNV